MSDRNVIAAENYRMYRGKPLVRKDRQLCYGSMEDKYVLKLEIMSTKKLGAKEVPDQVMVGIASTADGTIVRFGHGCNGIRSIVPDRGRAAGNTSEHGGKKKKCNRFFHLGRHKRTS